MPRQHCNRGLVRKMVVMPRILCMVCLLCVLAGCTDQQRVAELEAQVTSLKVSLELLHRDRELEKMIQGLDEMAYLTPGAEGYSIIQTDLGRMTVQLDDVQSYANGSRVTLRFGNPLSASINGAKAVLEWGGVDEKGTPKNDSAHSREVTFSKKLLAGYWTTVPVVLEGVQPVELGFVRVKNLTHTGISLNI